MPTTVVVPSSWVSSSCASSAAPIAPLIGGPGDSELSAVPAVGQDHPDRVGARPQQGRDVVGLHLQARRTEVKPGVSSAVPIRIAVQERLVRPLGGDPQSCGLTAGRPGRTRGGAGAPGTGSGLTVSSRVRAGPRRRSSRSGVQRARARTMPGPDRWTLPRSVQTLTCHPTRCREPTAGCPYGTRRLALLSTLPGVPAVSGPDPIAELADGAGRQPARTTVAR